MNNVPWNFINLPSRGNPRSTNFENILSSDLVNFYRILTIDSSLRIEENQVPIICL